MYTKTYIQTLTHTQSYIYIIFIHTYIHIYTIPYIQTYTLFTIIHIHYIHTYTYTHIYNPIYTYRINISRNWSSGIDLSHDISITRHRTVLLQGGVWIIVWI